MFHKSVAVLDIRSSVVTAAVAERGVNHTFVIKSKFSCEYDGFAENELLDFDNFSQAITTVIRDTVSALNKPIKKLYVSVPGEFLSLVCVDKTLSFSSAKTIKNADVNNLLLSAIPQDVSGFTCIKSGSVYYTLSDKRRTVEPVGEMSESLQAKLCFYLAKNTFIGQVVSVLEGIDSRIKPIFVPEIQAQTQYLLAPEQRDKYAVLFDLGYISSTFSVVYGNGVVYSESFSLGVGHLAFLLSSELDIPYDVALGLLEKVNLNASDRQDNKVEYTLNGQIKTLSSALLREKLRFGIDGLCETIEECVSGYAGNLDGKTLFITGEGVNVIRGTAEHISARMERDVQTIAPNLPYYDKPQLSSLFSLLNVAMNG